MGCYFMAINGLRQTRTSCGSSRRSRAARTSGGASRRWLASRPDDVAARRGGEREGVGDERVAVTAAAVGGVGADGVEARRRAVDLQDGRRHHGAARRAPRGSARRRPPPPARSGRRAARPPPRRARHRRQSASQSGRTAARSTCSTRPVGDPAGRAIIPACASTDQPRRPSSTAVSASAWPNSAAARWSSPTSARSASATTVAASTGGVEEQGVVLVGERHRRGAQRHAARHGHGGRRGPPHDRDGQAGGAGRRVERGERRGARRRRPGPAGRGGRRARPSSAPARRRAGSASAARSPPTAPRPGSAPGRGRAGRGRCGRRSGRWRPPPPARGRTGARTPRPSGGSRRRPAPPATRRGRRDEGEGSRGTACPIGRLHGRGHPLWVAPRGN